MTEQRTRYDADHWLRSHDPEKALNAYMDQQSKMYSKVKNAFIRELLGDLRDKSVLDYGCGAGMFLVHAARRGAKKIVGVDAEPTALATAEYFLKSEGLENCCQFLVNNRFPAFKAGTAFDVVLMKDVIEHVPEDRDLLDAASTVVAKGGAIVLCTQNSLSLNYLLEGAYQRFIRKNRSWYGWDPTHVRFYTPISLAKKLRASGFSPDAWRSVYLVPYKLPALPWSQKQFLRIDPLARIDRLLGGLFPYKYLGWNFVVRARKR